MSENNDVNLTPKDTAYILLHEIDAQVETLRSRPEAERGIPDKALTEQWIQIRKRSFDLLDQQGYGEITVELLDANWEYHNTLFFETCFALNSKYRARRSIWS